MSYALNATSTTDLPDLPLRDSMSIELRARELARESYDDRDDAFRDWLEQEFDCISDCDYWLDVLRAKCDDDRRHADERLRDLYVSKTAERFWDRAYDEHYESSEA